MRGANAPLTAVKTLLSLVCERAHMAEQASSKKVVNEQDIDRLRQRLNAIKHFL